MWRDFCFIVVGYLSGSILFARVVGQLVMHQDVTLESPDQNPGASNAFHYGGFWCGFFTLLGDMLKGFLPVLLYRDNVPDSSYSIGLAFVLAAPVLGHTFPVFYRFHGGKGIAVSFGSLLGLMPEMLPAYILAGVFIFFTVILQVTPHYHRTILTYLCAMTCMMLFVKDWSIVIGFALITIFVNLRMRMSTEKKEKCKVKLF